MCKRGLVLFLFPNKTYVFDMLESPSSKYLNHKVLILYFCIISGSLFV